MVNETLIATSDMCSYFISNRCNITELIEQQNARNRTDLMLHLSMYCKSVTSFLCTINLH